MKKIHQILLFLTQTSNNQADILLGQALELYRHGDYNQALCDINSTIAIVEDLRTKIINKDLRTSYFAIVQNYYQLKIKLLMWLNYKYPKQGANPQLLKSEVLKLSVKIKHFLLLLQKKSTNSNNNIKKIKPKSEKVARAMLPCATCFTTQAFTLTFPRSSGVI